MKRRERAGRTTPRSTNPRRWSRRVTETSNALDLEQEVFTLQSPRAIAESLRRSAERSTRRKAPPFRSALSMLVFYINRAGKNLSPARRRTLERAKDELRVLFGRERSLPRRHGTSIAVRSRRTTRRTAKPHGDV